MLLVVLVVLVGLEEDESGPATCWFKDDGDDDATITWFKDFASWHAGGISTHLVPFAPLC